MERENTSAPLDIPPGTRELLARFGFDLQTFQLLQERLRSGQADERNNRLQTPLSPPATEDLITLPALGSEERAALARLGNAAIARNEIAVVVLAGGMATRFGGGAKACASVLPGLSFLQLKIADTRRAAQAGGGLVPLYVMTSFATDDAIKGEVHPLSHADMPVLTFAQFASLRLTPTGALFRERDGTPSVYAPGHGDFAPALRRSGVLAVLLARGVKQLVMTNIDNLVATLDPALLGLHVSTGAALSFEVVRSQPGDVGGVPARVDGRLQVIEGFRQPLSFHPESTPLFSTNSFIFQADALNASFPLDWFVVSKQVDGRPALQFERLVNQLTAFLPSKGVIVERTGDDARFLPVKSRAELEVVRRDLERLLTRRGVLSSGPRQ
jgi:UTP--glucose-1-phosphate uridylyltransferase